ncbi:MAG: YwaF family protein [Clostridia bacterium]|nr:YwaF family protein [Clostridia bacterium]MBR3152221.1 YwaF family protein [Clostridia bacterium]MBR3152242.1 YwaF family protein [Clostridia bacterium]
MFLAKPGKYDACGIFTEGHFILLIVTSIIIAILLFLTRKKKEKEVLNIIRFFTVLLVVLEVLKIIFNFCVGNGSNLNNYVPLYFCSLILYAGILSSFCKGKIKRTGDVFIATGAIIAGISFLIYPNTSLRSYPIFHFISIHSFLLHGSMIYLGLLVNVTNYIKLEKEDIKYYFVFILIIGILAFIINTIFGSNLMFISRNFPNTPIEQIYNATGNLFPVVMVMGHATIPFYLVLGIVSLIKKMKKH